MGLFGGIIYWRREIYLFLIVGIIGGGINFGGFIVGGFYGRLGIKFM